MQALSAALQLRLRVEYLDGSSMPWSPRAGMHRHVICGPRDDKIWACLLFRPGHYDLLAPRDWAEAAADEDRGACFVPPLPPPMPPKTACGTCGARGRRRCWLCAQAVCCNAPCALYGQPDAQEAFDSATFDVAFPSLGGRRDKPCLLFHKVPDAFVGGEKPKDKDKEHEGTVVCATCQARRAPRARTRALRALRALRAHTP